jgi:putative peptidoglycan lipid II flippase
MRTRETGRATLVVMLGIGVSRVFGLVREQVVAFYFGRAATYSAFVAAYKIPNFVRVLLGEGDLSASFIPVLAERMRAADSEEARRLARSVLGLVLFVVGVVTIVGMVTAPLLAWVVAPGFDPELRALVARLIVILFPTSVFMVAGAWCMGVLHTHGRFFWPNMAPLFWSIVSAGALIAFVGRTPWDPIWILAWGVVAGSAVQLAVQLPATLTVLGTLAPRGGWGDPGVRRVVALFLPMLVGTGVAQISTLVDVQIATFLGNEGVATLAYAQRLYTLPLSLFGVAITQVALPTFAHQAVAEGAAGAAAPVGVVPGRIGEELGRSWRRMAYFVLPSSLGLAAFGRPAVSLLFEHGAFDAGDTTAVTWVLAAYAAGLLAYASTRLFATAFYALQDTRTPVRVALVALAANVLLGVALAWRLGTPGIALATALASTLNGAILARRLRRRLGGLFAPGIWASARSMALAAAVAGLVGILPYLWVLDRWPGWGLGARLAMTAALYGLVGGAYILTARALGVHLPLRRRHA